MSDLSVSPRPVAPPPVAPPPVAPPLPVAPPPDRPFALPAGLGALSAAAPVVRVSLLDGSQAWLVTRHAEARAVLGDHRRFSSVPTAPGYPRSGMVGGSTADTAVASLGFIRMDPPDHTRIRRMLTHEFMVRRIEELRPGIERIADELCDAMERAPRPVDLVADFALPLTSSVIGLLLGVPAADHPLFRDLTARANRIANTPREAARVLDELAGYLDELVAAKEREPGDDLLGRLVVERLRTGELSRPDLLAVAAVLLIGGFETTANMISLSALSLMRDPETAERLRREPALMKGAVTELLRFHGIIRNGPRRAVTEDVEIGGQRLAAGEGVIIAVSAANRDPEEFQDPDTVDVCRPNASRHVAFGFGVHQCLGQTLARLELQVALATLSRRFPAMRPAAPLARMRFRADMTIYGLHALPVIW
ncbi:cytochrome P450 [Actinoalloteichus hoggarensis]|uniref:Cytochrome P450-SU2 n=1 Tax=Actinoalloteichus hoggarensis TaxID=1470176 RepID=A0A221W5C1_9PSEU|nr:cytochrome P450 [Actinoalloteichus hoggarensis]ASO20749.1 Cytochrome P450-SU2 [Actinoalloteichus hoggarensis]MBB5920679.1 cytochrome P450 [Actinoalloteichus hoggarensis]